MDNDVINAVDSALIERQVSAFCDLVDRYYEEWAKQQAIELFVLLTDPLDNVIDSLGRQTFAERNMLWYRRLLGGMETLLAGVSSIAGMFSLIGLCFVWLSWILDAYETYLLERHRIVPTLDHPSTLSVRRGKRNHLREMNRTFAVMFYVQASDPLLLFVRQEFEKNGRLMFR